MKQILTIITMLLAAVTGVNAQTEDHAEAMSIWMPDSTTGTLQKVPMATYNFEYHPQIAANAKTNDITINISDYNTRTIPFTPGMKITFGAAENLKGDVNCDGKVTTQDATLVTKTFVGKHAEGLVPQKADVNADGKVTMNDANTIVNIAKGK